MSTGKKQEASPRESAQAHEIGAAPAESSSEPASESDDELVTVNDPGRGAWNGVVGWLRFGPAVQILKSDLQSSSSYALEEYKELGHEYRYRESIVITQSQLAIFVSATIGYNARWTSTAHSWEYLPLRFVGASFLSLIWLHLRNLNHDRLATGARRSHLATELKLFKNHRGKATRRSSGPALMQKFIGLLAVLWWLWFFCRVICQYCTPA